jgi:hypothetical protein
MANPTSLTASEAFMFKTALHRRADLRGRLAPLRRKTMICRITATHF